MSYKFNPFTGKLDLKSDTANLLSKAPNTIFVIDNGDYATLQDAIDSAPDNTTFVIGPKVGGWGNIVLPEKTLSFYGLVGERPEMASIGSVTCPTGVNPTEANFTNLLFTQPSGENTVLVGGTGVYKLRFNGCRLFRPLGDTTTMVAAVNDNLDSSIYFYDSRLRTENDAVGGRLVDTNCARVIFSRCELIGSNKSLFYNGSGRVDAAFTLFQVESTQSSVEMQTGTLIAPVTTFFNGQNNGSGLELGPTAVASLQSVSFIVNPGSGFAIRGSGVVLAGSIDFNNVTGVNPKNTSIENTIVQFNNTVNFMRPDFSNSIASTKAIDFGGFKGVNLADPTNNQDAVTLDYFNNNLPSGGIVWSDPVDANILPDSSETRNLGSATNQFNQIHLQSSKYYQGGSPNLSAEIDNSGSEFVVRGIQRQVIIETTTTSNFTPDMNVRTGGASLQSGNLNLSSGDSGSTSGNVVITAGPATNRGNILLVNGSEGTVGHVWTSTGINGEGEWAPASGGISVLDNNVFFKARNASDTADVSLFKYSDLNVFESSPLTVKLPVGPFNFDINLEGQYITFNNPFNGSPQRYIRTASESAQGTCAVGLASGSVTGAAVAAQSGNVNLFTGQHSGTGQSGQISLLTGSNTGTGNSGNINITTGSVVSGTRGGVLFDSQFVDFTDVTDIDFTGVNTIGLPSGGDLWSDPVDANIIPDASPRDLGSNAAPFTNLNVSVINNIPDDDIAFQFTDPGQTTFHKSIVPNINDNLEVGSFTNNLAQVYTRIVQSNSSLTLESPNTIQFFGSDLNLTGMASVDFTGVSVSGLPAGGDLWSDPVNANIIPDANNTRDIGNLTNRFRRAYINEIWSTSGLFPAITISQSVISTPPIVPNGPLLNLGQNANRWGTLFLSSSLDMGSLGPNSSPFIFADRFDLRLNPPAGVMPSFAPESFAVGSRIANGSIGFYTVNVSSPTKSGDIYIESGNNAGAGNSGNIVLKTGTSTAVRGKIKLDALMATLPVGTVDPTGVDDGDCYYKTDTNELRVFNNGVWRGITFT